MNFKEICLLKENKQNFFVFLKFLFFKIKIKPQYYCITGGQIIKIIFLINTFFCLIFFKYQIYKILNPKRFVLKWFRDMFKSFELYLFQ